MAKWLGALGLAAAGVGGVWAARRLPVAAEVSRTARAVAADGLRRMRLPRGAVGPHASGPRVSRPRGLPRRAPAAVPRPASVAGVCLGALARWDGHAVPSCHGTDPRRAARLAKAALTAALGGYAALTAFGNVTDPAPNREFVRHVLTMDDRAPELAELSRNGSRAIHRPWVWRAAYGCVIGGEALVGGLCLVSSWRQVRAAGAAHDHFARAASTGIAGAAGALLLWFLGFQTVGGEWFGMWMNQHWNGLDSAARVCGYAGVVLLLLCLPEEADVPGRAVREVRRPSR
ncbi:Hypothetical protein SCATT_p07480 (plasmid) [Streptantibioticus cattleyicolor NRRL 8057 = DSM 46488]|uniref:DUF2165 domain-containing protein n=1 Tax=Streptantibioticus cattleyicolor (strain ATCC 35852 / DSM 46488 / JCM 4925 / NBRC 14057 / NRRL 8057) TaxID=1003195 RepID=F8JIX3_STREN|nr:Hypothetical protein SCATT_p07480 [Streptantibioticus cattleyicolor NRRL 8057 = DSM 46488]CCB72012.1 Putative membrane protein (modular protein) [Streptantibioticus cattleyicolor NRRL 8057 = DSM 46488]